MVRGNETMVAGKRETVVAVVPMAARHKKRAGLKRIRACALHGDGKVYSCNYNKVTWIIC